MHVNPGSSPPPAGAAAPAPTAPPVPSAAPPPPEPVQPPVTAAPAVYPTPTNSPVKPTSTPPPAVAAAPEPPDASGSKAPTDKAANQASTKPSPTSASHSGTQPPAPERGTASPGHAIGANNADKAQEPPALDLASLQQRLRDTHAIGLFTKLSLKNQVDDLLNEFRAFYSGRAGVSLADLRQRYDLLLMKVLSLLQDSDPPLASAVSGSRDAIWSILSDRQKFEKI